ncbi:hypothetical protein GOPIP_087_01780 [Gordonia polyisoprenivorans NBRC 16320 = JCM 10675]|nr:hypothetical protein GOPIP_087_01780 [Gordonia polyisoprenivorans NBRC 16320 = JCM 10675]
MTTRALTFAGSPLLVDAVLDAVDGPADDASAACGVPDVVQPAINRTEVVAVAAARELRMTVLRMKCPLCRWFRAHRSHR